MGLKQAFVFLFGSVDYQLATRKYAVLQWFELYKYTCNRGLQIAGQTLIRCTKPCHPETNWMCIVFLVSNICLNEDF